jgi:hypothetical protein
MRFQKVKSLYTYFSLIRLIPEFYDMYIMYSQYHFIKKNSIYYYYYLQSKVQKIKLWLRLLWVHVSMIAPRYLNLILRGNTLVNLKGKTSIVDVTTFCTLQLCAKLVLVGLPLFLGIHPLITTLGCYDL